MNNEELLELKYMEGSRASWNMMLLICLKNLGYDSEKSKNYGWITEKESAIVQLRMLCEDFGDNNWDENLHLADVIDKHLGNYLYENIENIKDVDM